MGTAPFHLWFQFLKRSTHPKKNDTIVNGDWLNSWVYACAYFAPDPTSEICISQEKGKCLVFLWLHLCLSYYFTRGNQAYSTTTRTWARPSYKNTFRNSWDFCKTLASSKSFRVFKAKEVCAKMRKKIFRDRNYINNAFIYSLRKPIGM